MSLIAAFVGFTSTVRFFLRRNKTAQRLFSIRTTSWFTRQALKLLNIHIFASGSVSASFQNQRVLLVSNHLSYLDILIIAAGHPSVFVTSMEVRESSFLGLLCRLGGSYFVERRNIFVVLRDLKGLQDVLRDGFRIVLFAEGTSSDGRQVLPMKSALMAAAMNEGVLIQPVCINYRRVDHIPVSETHRSALFYYGDMEFFPHLWRFLKLKSVDVDLTFLDAINSRQHSSRRSLTQKVFEHISNSYIPVA